MAEDFGLSLRDMGRYFQVTRVASGSAAQRAGILTGDVLARIDGQAIRSDLDVILAFSKTRPGRVYHLDMRRSGLEHAVALVTPK